MRPRSFAGAHSSRGLALSLGFAFACNDPPKTTATADAAVVAAADAGPVQAIPTPAASVLAMVNPYGSPAYAGPTGSVEGVISYVGDPPAERPTHADLTKCPHAEEVYGKEFRLGGTTPQGKELLDTIVAVTGYKDFYVPETHEGVPVEIDGCAISPRTILATFGQRLEVRNKGPDLVAPAIDQGVNAAMMVSVPRTPDPIFLYPRRPGRFGLTDKLGHPFMLNDLYVVLQPLHAVTDAHGHYRIDGVPVGKLTVNATHPAFTSEANHDVDIVAGVVARVDLVLTQKKKDAGAPPAPSTTARPPR